MLERSKIAMILAEFLGTAILTAVVLAVSRSNVGFSYFVALAAGLTIAVGTLMFAAVSGAHFNPIVTIGLWTTRQVRSLTAIVYVAAQLLGGAVGYLLFSYLTNTHIKNAGAYSARILIAEAVGAFIFSLGWAAVVYRKMENGKAAFAVGAALALGIIVASTGSTGILNPAVALGVRSWVWGTYVLGPILGAVIGFNLYALLFASERSLLVKKTSSSKK